nr:MAG TPA: hypothetical protein [Caudoviricetes sp.]
MIIHIYALLFKKLSLSRGSTFFIKIFLDKMYFIMYTLKVKENKTKEMKNESYR